MQNYKKSNSDSSLYAFNMFLNYNFIKYLTKYKNKHTNKNFNTKYHFFKIVE